MRIFCVIFSWFMSVSFTFSGTLQLANSKRSSYYILIPEQATAYELKGAQIFQNYFQQVTDVLLPISDIKIAAKSNYVSIGQTSQAHSMPLMHKHQEAFSIHIRDRNIYLQGGINKGVLYAVYQFIEDYMGCRKWTAGAKAFVPSTDNLIVPDRIDREEKPAFDFREVYFPVEEDAEYMDWHKLHSLEDLWGLWGHSFDKLVPASEYFQKNPAYFSYFLGERRPGQLCLSNKDVLQITIKTIKKKLAENPDARYWSISPNDELGFCECDQCKAVDEEEGGPQGSLIRFVNKVANAFPNQTFTTLAYTYSAKPPLKTKPAKNVTIILSSIDAYRRQSLTTEPSANTFRQYLTGWTKLTENIFVWDYYTQFTNYLAPFPNMQTIRANVNYLHKMGVSGVFAQGSGNTYSDMSELKSYLLAKMLWNPKIAEQSIIGGFLNGYYGKAAPIMQQYLDVLLAAANEYHVSLDIYGNPINDHNGYLSPQKMDIYSALMDKAEALVETDSVSLSHVLSVRLTHEYTFLQQARFFGLEKHGIFEQAESGEWRVRPGLRERVNRFREIAESSGVKMLAEDRRSLPAYINEWQQIFADGVRSNKALQADISLKYPFSPSYPAKGWRTLVDGTPGYDDYSYNWLCFYGTPMEFVLDLKKTQSIEKISLNFLEDPRHWIFRPKSLSVQVSIDGKHFKPVGVKEEELLSEHYEIEKVPYEFILKEKSTIRYIKVYADNFIDLPKWRFHKNKQIMIACDEIWVD